MSEAERLDEDSCLMLQREAVSDRIDVFIVYLHK